MRETATIKLATPLVTHSGSLNQIVLREPTFDEYMSFGDPYTVAASASGHPFAIENPDVIRQYLTVCLVEPKDPALLAQAGARVAREVKDRLLGFFQAVTAQPDADSGTTPTTSPSADTASGPENSKA